MNLDTFVAKAQRPLPIFVLADTSGSMSGEKINQLNLALREMLQTLRNTDDIWGTFQLSVITFGGSVNVLQTLSDIGDIALPEFEAAGNTPMGQAFEVLGGMLEDREVVLSKAYTPTIVLISDGLPTDCTDEVYSQKNYLEWQPLRALHEGARSSKCQRLALGIGADADFEMLKAFVNHPEIPVIKTGGASGITKFFRWVTMSTVARMNSVNPNDASVVAPLPDLDEEEILI